MFCKQRLWEKALYKWNIIIVIIINISLFFIVITCHIKKIFDTIRKCEEWMDLGISALLSQCLSPPRSVNEYQQIVEVTWQDAEV